MQYIFIDSNKKIGGIEKLFIDMALYLNQMGEEVYFLVEYEDSIYYRYLGQLENVHFIIRNSNIAIKFLSNKEIKNEKQYILNKLDTSKNYVVIAAYFKTFQQALAFFGSEKNFKLIHYWAHPQSWALELFTKKNIITKRKENICYNYQRKLLQELDRRNADIRGSETGAIYNNWFYNLQIDRENVIPLPIKKLKIATKESNTPNIENNKKKILWCGRFTYFKNEAIIHIHKTLEKIAVEHKNLKLEYHIIGFGNSKNTTFVKKSIIPNKVKVIYHGMVNHEELIAYYLDCDIGIGMGTTIRQMALAGLPSIIIDSVNSENKQALKANWLYDSFVGDAGDNFYCEIAGHTLTYRTELKTLLDSIILDPEKLIKVGIECKNYVEKNHDEDLVMQKFINYVNNSTFNGVNYPLYRVNSLERLRRNILRKIKKFLKERIV